MFTALTIWLTLAMVFVGLSVLGGWITSRRAVAAGREPPLPLHTPRVKRVNRVHGRKAA